MINFNLQQLEREILEVLKSLGGGHKGLLPTPEMILGQTNEVGRFAHDWPEYIWVFEGLEAKRQIDIMGRDQDDHFGVRLTHRGYERLGQSEVEYQKSMRPSSSPTFNTTFEAPVANFAQTAGDNSPVHQATSYGADIQQIADLIAKFRTEITNRSDIPHDEAHEADILDIDVHKSKPNLERLKMALVWLKTLEETYSALAPIASVLGKAISKQFGFHL